jgi:hypothetical protein
MVGIRLPVSYSPSRVHPCRASAQSECTGIAARAQRPREKNSAAKMA